MRMCRLAANPRNSLVTETVFLDLEAVLEPGHGSPTLAGFGRSRDSLTDPESDPVFVIFACILLLPLGREYAILESVGSVGECTL